MPNSWWNFGGVQQGLIDDYKRGHYRSGSAGGTVGMASQPWDVGMGSITCQFHHSAWDIGSVHGGRRWSVIRWWQGATMKVMRFASDGSSGWWWSSQTIHGCDMGRSHNGRLWLNRLVLEIGSIMTIGGNHVDWMQGSVIGGGRGGSDLDVKGCSVGWSFHRWKMQFDHLVIRMGGRW